MTRLIGLVEDGFLLGDAEKEGGAAEVVDLAGDSLGAVVDECQKAIGENRVLTTVDAEMALDVGSGLLEVEGFEVVADGDALFEDLEGGEAECGLSVRREVGLDSPTYGPGCRAGCVQPSVA